MEAEPIHGEREVVALAVTPRELERGSQRRVYVRSLKRCFACRGDRPECQVCSGEGRVPDEWLVDVEVPAGSKIGGVITASGQGEKGTRGGSDGDLIIVVVPRRTGQPVDGADYIEGLEVDQERLREGGSEYFPLLGFGPCEDHHVPECNACSDQGWSLIDASRVITIPPNSQWGLWLRIPGEGMPGADGGQAGDLYVQLAPPGYDDEPLPDLGTIDTTLAEPALPYRTLLVENDGEQEQVEVGEYFHATAAPEGSEAHFQTQAESRSQPDEPPPGWVLRPGEDVLRYVGREQAEKEKASLLPGSEPTSSPKQDPPGWITLPGHDSPTYFGPAVDRVAGEITDQVTAHLSTGGDESAIWKELSSANEAARDAPSAPAPAKKPSEGPENGLNVYIILSVPARKMRKVIKQQLDYMVLVRCTVCGGSVGCEACEYDGFQRWQHIVEMELGPYPEGFGGERFEGMGYHGRNGGTDGALIVLFMTEGQEWHLNRYVPAPSKDRPMVHFYSSINDVKDF